MWNNLHLTHYHLCLNYKTFYYAWQQNPYPRLPARTHPALTGFSSLTGFGYEFMFSPISQHGYKMGNMDIHTCLEHIPKLILNAENYFIPYWDLPCYNNCLWNLMEQPNYPVMEMWILTYCWKMQYNIFLGARKKMIHCGDEDATGIPKPVWEGDEIQFLTPIGFE